MEAQGVDIMGFIWWFLMEKSRHKSALAFLRYW